MNHPTTTPATDTLLQFTPFQSAIDASFWHAFADKKLNLIQLSQDPQPLHAHFALGFTNNILPPQLCLPGQALEENTRR
jgi:ubiquitin-like modifier-activating enzyme ATG7